MIRSSKHQFRWMHFALVTNELENDVPEDSYRENCGVRVAVLERRSVAIRKFEEIGLGEERASYLCE